MLDLDQVLKCLREDIKTLSKERRKSRGSDEHWDIDDEVQELKRQRDFALKLQSLTNYAKTKGIE